MKKWSLMPQWFLFACLLPCAVKGQERLTPEQLWQLGRVSVHEVDNTNQTLLYKVSRTDMAANKNGSTYFSVPLAGGEATALGGINAPMARTEIKNAEGVKWSADNKYALFSREVPIQAVKASDRYTQWPKANAYVYDQLNQRHWDTWEDGSYSHVFVAEVGANNQVMNERDLMAGEAFDCPGKPHGGSDDYLFTPDGKGVIYVCKKKSGTAYALSTNTDLYYVDLKTGKTTNLTEGRMGYDNQPQFSADGRYLAWLSMARDGFESDQNELMVMDWSTKRVISLTETWDETLDGFSWSADNQRIFFVAPHRGTQQLYAATLFADNFQQRVNNQQDLIVMLTDGPWEITGIQAVTPEYVVVGLTDFNHAAELYTYNLKSRSLNQLTQVNNDFYSKIAMCPVSERYSTGRSGKPVFSWVVYPPNFDSTKKYPLLLYCQGGPQGALTPFYSFRWNLQLMAQQGYIVIAPNRTGMPGWGRAWNEDISKDWGGQPIDDYLTVVDDISEESYVDKSRRGAVGASYGGYSVFMLAGVHNGRFKTFISHCGLFDMQSWYGTTEELFFANWDIGGPYWDKKNYLAQRTYREFNPSRLVENWNTPMLIIQGGIDFRVPVEQGMQAFQAAQLKGIKSRFLYFPDENHWVLKPQNALVWQTEFFQWLKETL
jgi:dipeptidyl aminopeptidase/acylaminoacyl peptidase